jgi:hypothetical protein
LLDIGVFVAILTPGNKEDGPWFPLISRMRSFKRASGLDKEIQLRHVVQNDQLQAPAQALFLQRMAMAPVNAGNAATRPSLDTSSFSFPADENIRSPRTPTYIPDTPSPEFIVPVEHAKMIIDSRTDLYGNTSTAKWTPPPEEPMAWVWICHLCHSRYSLGVTRRCLIDGHYYCSGETDRPSLRKKRKNKSCSSEFDYVAWKAWGEWRRKALQTIKNPRVLRGCEKCEFPSQCRYPAEPQQTSTSTANVDESLPQKSSRKDSKDKEANVKAKAATEPTSNKSIDFDQILSNMFHKEENVDSKGSETQDPGSTSRKKGSSKKKTSQKGLIPSLEEEMSKEAVRLRALVGMDLWSTLQDVELEKAKVE